MLNYNDLASYRLIYPDLKYLDSYVEALEEGFVLSLGKPMSEEGIEQVKLNPSGHIQDLNLQGGKVVLPDGQEVLKEASAVFWLVNETEFLGAIGVVYDLNEYLKDYGGHLGVGIRPNKRGQNLGTVAVALICTHCLHNSISPVLAFCNVNNIAMNRAFQKNGGIHMDDIMHPYFDDTTVRRYHIFPDAALSQQIIKNGLVPLLKPENPGSKIKSETKNNQIIPGGNNV